MPPALPGEQCEPAAARGTPGTWRGCVGSRGASSGGAPRGVVAGGRVRGCTVIFGSTKLWAGQTPGPGAATREEAVRPQPHLRVLNGGSFRPPLASRPGVAGTRQPSRAAHRLPRRPRPPEGRAPGTRRCRTPLAPLTPSATFAGHTPCARDHRRPRGHCSAVGLPPALLSSDSGRTVTAWSRSPAPPWDTLREGQGPQRGRHITEQAHARCPSGPLPHPRRQTPAILYETKLPTRPAPHSHAPQTRGCTAS